MKPSNFYHIRYFHYKYLPKIKKVKKILDIGCGGGELTQELKEKYKKATVVGCDLYPKMKNTVKCSAEKLSFKNNSFDCVFMFDVLEHLKSPQKAFGEVKRVLKKGGVFHLVVPLEKNLFGINLQEKPIGHIQQFELNDIKNLVKNNGFKIKKIRYSYYFIYQFLSFIYYFYANFFKKGSYVQIMPDDNHKSLNLVKPFVYLLMMIINIDNYIFSQLGLKGQSLHITIQSIRRSDHLLH